MWKPVYGFEGLYEVSDQGLVRRVIGYQRRVEIILRPNPDHHGYLRVKLSANGRQTTHSVHKLVAEAFLGPLAADMTVNHKDCDKLNNAVSNLEYITRLENTRHAVENGRISLSGAKLSPEQVREIRLRYVPRTESSAILAEEFGVTRRTICRLIDGTNWHHLT